jgi:hypothetical protein
VPSGTGHCKKNESRSSLNNCVVRVGYDSRYQNVSKSFGRSTVAKRNAVEGMRGDENDFFTASHPELLFSLAALERNAGRLLVLARLTVWWQPVTIALLH